MHDAARPMRLSRAGVLVQTKDRQRREAVSVWARITTDNHDDLPACTDCGRCCHQTVDLVDGVDHVPEAMVVEHDGVRCMEQRGDGACVALDPLTRLCTIYENRPRTCREFDRGGGLCRQVLRRHDTALAARSSGEEPD